MSYFTSLNYSLGEEDSQVEHALLAEKPGARVLAVAGSGSRIIPLLACAPARLVCVDVSRWQLAMTALRLALVKDLELEQFLGFMGYTQEITPSQRRNIFARLDICRNTRADAGALLESIGWSAPLYIGRFEKMIRQLGWVNALVTGTAGREIFECQTLEQQQEYYRSRFPRTRWSMIVSVLGNATVFNGLLYKGEFPRNNTGSSTVSNYTRIFDRLFENHLVRRSFFLQMLFFGEIRYSDGFPFEADPVVYAAARKGLARCDISYRFGSILEGLQQGETADFFSLSDVPSFLPDNVAASVLQHLRPQLEPSGMIVFRSHLRYIPPDESGFVAVAEKYHELVAAERTGLWRFGIFQKDEK